ncbi:MAG: hypothetical protein ACP5NW_05680 [Candidatus Woesearchaeota archaeon]
MISMDNIGQWKRKYPFLEDILAFETHIFEERLNANVITELDIREGIIDEMLLDKKSHDAHHLYEQGLPAYRIYSSDSSMPNREGPVMTYAIIGKTVQKLGLEWQLVDKDYIDDGYEAEARLAPFPRSIREELHNKGVSNPDYIVCRDRKQTHLTFEIYRRANDQENR